MEYKNPETIGERIREARLSLKLDQKEFGALLGVTNSTISGWEQNTTILKDIKKIEKIAKLTNRSIYYFLEGLEIETLHEPITPYTAYVLIPFYNAELDSSESNKGSNYPIPFKFRVDWLKNFGDVKKLKLWLMRDNEMRPLIYCGDVCLVNAAETEIIDGEVYLFSDGYRKQVRRLQYKGTDILVTSPNKVFEPYPVKCENIKILGRIRWIGHSI